MSAKNGLFPVLGRSYAKSQYGLIDLGIDNQSLKAYKVDTPNGMQNFLTVFRKENHITIPYGGYGEKRFIYMKSPLFKENERCIHLGIDLWMPEGTPIYSSDDAIVHSYANNDQYLDYGATIILEYQSPSYFVLYGHLSLLSIKGLSKGQKINKGEVFATIGNYAENGNWEPHLHLQKIKKIGDAQGDYPGVCTEADKTYFLDNCPNPLTLIFP